MFRLVMTICFSIVLVGCIIPKNIFLHVRPHAEHVKQVEHVPQSCIDLGMIKLFDFPEYEDLDYNRDHFIKYATNIAGKRGGDTFRIVKRFKTYEAPEGYPKETYLNGIAQAFRCVKKESFVIDKKLTVNITSTEPHGCKLMGEDSAYGMYIDDVEMDLRESAVADKANAAFIYKEEKIYKLGSSRAHYAYYEAYAKLYSCT